MDQQQIDMLTNLRNRDLDRGDKTPKVSFSVGTKLLISIVSLLLIIILFLNISTILLFRGDKKAYIYQSQSTEALLAGKQFDIIAKHALDTLRTCLATVDPKNPLAPSQSLTLQSILDNQTEVLVSSIYLANRKTGVNLLYSRTSKTKEILSLGMTPKDYDIPVDWMLALLPDLIQNGYGFINLSKPGNIPILGVAFADTSLKDHPRGMPLAVGLVPLQDLSKELNNLKLTVATRSGWVLYDTDPTVLFAKENLFENPLFKAAISSQLTNGAQEYESEGTHYLGSYVITDLNLVILTKTEWAKAMKATYMFIEKFILLGSMSVGAAVIFAILFAKTLTAPLERLYDATREVAKGNFLLKLDEKGGDEIGALSQSFNSMSKKISELIQESIKKVHLENEFAIASTVQQTLIPGPDFKNDWLHIHSHYQSASECGGDWWGFFGVDKKVAIMIADATGHGLPCALMTASARSCFSVMQKLAQEDPEFSFSPSAMLSYANRVVFDASLGKIMMTFFIGVIDFDAKTLQYSSAGHNPPWLFKKEGNHYSLKSLTAVGQRLGESREVPPFEEKSISLNPLDLIFFYTDGLTEGKDSSGQMYGKKRVRKLVETNLQGGPEKVIKSLMDDFMKHNGNKSLDDDVTIAAAMLLNS